jgi:DNA-binding transcriptional ArsR family regulator
MWTEMSSTPATVHVAFDRHGERLAGRWLEERPARVQVLGFATLRTVLIGLAGHDDQAPPGMVEAAREALEPHDLAIITAVYRQPVFVPDCIAHDPEWGDVSPEEELERVRTATPDDLLAELDVAGPDGETEPWRSVRRNPRAFLARHHRALDRTWAAIEPFWARAAGGLEREVTRASMAIARGAVGELLLDQRRAVRAGAACDLRVDERGITLIPQLAGPQRRDLRRRDGDVLTHIAYPVPGAARIVSEDPVPDSLEALLGPQRTAILRRLDRPRTAGELADLLFAVPSAATHHVDALQSAGLVSRERRGRHVLVHRTARGTELLALYERA